MIPEAAVEASMRSMSKTVAALQPLFAAADVWAVIDLRAIATQALEAAAPHMLADMKPMTLMELAYRDRPGSIEAARAKVRAERKDAMAEQMRAAREAAWQEGMMDQFEADLLGKPSPDNPYMPTP